MWDSCAAGRYSHGQNKMEQLTSFPSPLLSSDEAARRAKRAILASLNLGGGGGVPNVQFIFVLDCRLLKK